MPPFSQGGNVHWKERYINHLKVHHGRYKWVLSVRKGYETKGVEYDPVCVLTEHQARQLVELGAYTEDTEFFHGRTEPKKDRPDNAASGDNPATEGNAAGDVHRERQ